MPKPKTATGEKNLISKRLIELREKNHMSQRMLAHQLQLRVMQLHDTLLLRTSASLHSVSVGAKPLSTGQCAPCRRLYQLGD